MWFTETKKSRDANNKKLSKQWLNPNLEAPVQGWFSNSLRSSRAYSLLPSFLSAVYTVLVLCICGLSLLGYNVSIIALGHGNVFIGSWEQKGKDSLFTKFCLLMHEVKSWPKPSGILILTSYLYELGHMHTAYGILESKYITKGLWGLYYQPGVPATQDNRESPNHHSFSHFINLKTEA